jgi:hypothetical protein
MMILMMLLACGAPHHLQYDFSRAYETSLEIQSNLARTSVVNEVYPLTGAEADGIRTQVVEGTTTESKQQVETATSSQ